MYNKSTWQLLIYNNRVVSTPVFADLHVPKIMCHPLLYVRKADGTNQRPR
jgi:hypothetical protein